MATTSMSVNRRTRNSLLVAGIAVAGAIAVWFGRSIQEQPSQSQSAEPRSERSQSPPGGDPRVQEFQERKRFQNDVREFFARARAMSPAERTSRAREIAQEITRYEAAGEVAAAEALTLREGLVRETVADPVEQLVAIRSLQELYQRQGARKQVEARSDPESELYKAREQAQ